MTEAQLTEHFPGLSVMDFKVLCNIATRSRVSVDNVNNALALQEETSPLLTILSDSELYKLIAQVLEDRMRENTLTDECILLTDFINEYYEMNNN